MLNEHSRFYILKGAQTIQAIEATAQLLRSELLAALGRDDKGSLFCRLSKECFSSRLSQVQQVVGSSENNDSGQGA